MSDLFDPYEQWLGIAPHERPVDHYRLLGLPHFEENLDRIRKAADERMADIRHHQVGKRGEFTHQILNELSAAKLCLLNPDTKSSYDEMLRGRYSATATSTPALPPAAAPTSAAMMPFDPNAPTLPTFGAPAPFAPSPFSPPAAFGLAPPPPPPPPLVGATGSSSGTPTKKKVKKKKVKKEVVEEEPEPFYYRSWFAPVFVLSSFTLMLGIWFYANRNQTEEVISGDSEPDILAESGSGSGNTVIDKTSNEPLPPLQPRIVVNQEGSGQINLSAPFAQIQGEHLKLGMHRNDRLIANWISAREYLSWRFKLVIPGTFKVQLMYYAPEAARDSVAIVEVGEQVVERKILVTRDTEKYTRDIFYMPLKEPGEKTIHLKVGSIAGEEFITFNSIILTPAQGTDVGP